MIVKLVAWVNSQDDTSVALKSVIEKLDTLQTKYASNSTVVTMITYLKS